MAAAPAAIVDKAETQAVVTASVLNLTLTVTGDKVLASMTVKSAEGEVGTVTVKWSAPAPSPEALKSGNYCTGSEITLKYNGPRWRTKANRTVYRDAFDCAGMWIALVVDANGKELAKASIVVPARKK
jgi:hypothetical protein